ncbi:hypothetical protein FA13DRAFT_339019 [Coprinellus micaceus]|uniref:Uncharacterized protein n=1 Tax=Coprinellus micaceus TaxID=71717 RepID=A0A4Y7TBX5_COPMI|nr:hypothetical protein FA13DRAFT_339019 [Coprinellus micaceus]
MHPHEGVGRVGLWFSTPSSTFVLVPNQTVTQKPVPNPHQNIGLHPPTDTPLRANRLYNPFQTQGIMSHKVSGSHRGLRDLFQALINRPDRGGHRAPKNEDESEPQTQDQDVSPPKGHAAMTISLSFISGSTVSAGMRNHTSREERKVTVEKLVSSAIASFGNSGQREMSLAVVDEPTPGNKYARVMFNNLSRSLNGGPGELLTHLTQDVFIEPSSKVQERRGRYPVFTDFTLEPVSVDQLAK